MGPKSRPRSRSAQHEDIAQCPFTLTTFAIKTPNERDDTSKKRKRDGEPDTTAKHPTRLNQSFPFELPGKADEPRDQAYAIKSLEKWKWEEMTRYYYFILNGQKYGDGDFIYVANAATKVHDRRVMTKDEQKGGDCLLEASDYWVAKILEIRAKDENHVYTRIYWMYWPDELPQNTLDGKRIISGRQPYHGQNELVASNHMDIISVFSVVTKVTVHQWIESEDDVMQDALYWRQTFDYLTCRISAAQLACRCQTPANPDKRLIGCTNSDCSKWLHEECLLHETMTRVYQRLGLDKPHESTTTEPLEANDDTVKTGLTSTNSNGSDSTTPPALMIERLNRDVSGSAPTPKIVDLLDVGVQTLTPEPKSGRLKGGKAASAKKRRGKNFADDKPLQGLFQASLVLSEGPIFWEITDLRPNIKGGERIWKERANCLVCNTTIQ